MHATVVRVAISDVDAATQQLTQEVVPQVSAAPGFVAGYWTRKDETGISMVIWESEEAAQAAAERLPQMIPEAVTLQDVEVREVVAHA